MLANVDPNVDSSLEEMREQNQRDSGKALYSVFTPFKDKFDEDKPIHAHNTPFMVMVARAAHSRGEKLVGGSTPYDTRKNSQASSISIYQDADHPTAAATTTEPHVGVEEEAEEEDDEEEEVEYTKERPAAQTPAASSSKRLVAIDEKLEDHATHSSTAADGFSPMERSVKALAFASPDAAVSFATKNEEREPEEKSAKCEDDAIQFAQDHTGNSTSSAASSQLQQLATRLAAVVHAHVAQNPDVVPAPAALAAVIRPHLADLVGQLRLKDTEEEAVHATPVAVAEANPVAAGETTPVVVAEATPVAAGEATPVAIAETAAAVAIAASTRKPSPDRACTPPTLSSANHGDAKALTEPTAKNSPSDSRQTRSASCGARISTPTTALDLLRTLSKESPVKSPGARVPRRSEPARKGPAPWRGSMDEIRRARLSSSQAAAAQQKPVARPRPMSEADARELLSTGHWFLKKLGNKRDYKPQPRFVWLHETGTGVHRRQLLCWDKNGRQRVPSKSQSIDLRNVRRTIWRSGKRTQLDFVDRTGGETSRKTLTIKGVAASTSIDAGVLRWTEAFVAVGFKVRDRGVKGSMQSAPAS
eukprot:INCI9386.1.p1 GENE.INCI9386.1~~INCI9386.1.p1  ORF type:complete len:590 (+),score=107.39 INCI9386.1:267-2036(+)